MTAHIQKAGRAICDKLDKDDWDDLSPIWRDKYCDAALAAFESVLPVGDDVVEAAENAYDESAVRHRHQVCQLDALIDALTAAIRAICGRVKE